MYLYAIAILALLVAIVFLGLTFVNYKKSGNAALTEEEKSKLVKKYKNDLLLFAVLAVLCEVFILLANKTVQNL